MPGMQRPAALRYGVAVLTAAAAVLLTARLPALRRVPTTLLFLALVLSAWLGGLGPSLLAAGLGLAALGWLLLPHTTSFEEAVAQAERLGSFTLVAALIVWLQATTGRAQAAAAQALEWERRAHAAARETIQEKDRMLHVLGHELRSPLAALQNALHLLHEHGTLRR